MTWSQTLIKIHDSLRRGISVDLVNVAHIIDSKEKAQEIQYIVSSEERTFSFLSECTAIYPITSNSSPLFSSILVRIGALVLEDLRVYPLSVVKLLVSDLSNTSQGPSSSVSYCYNLLINYKGLSVCQSLEYFLQDSMLRGNKWLPKVMACALRLLELKEMSIEKLEEDLIGVVEHGEPQNVRARILLKLLVSTDYSSIQDINRIIYKVLDNGIYILYSKQYIPTQYKIQFKDLKFFELGLSNVSSSVRIDVISGLMVILSSFTSNDNILPNIFDLIRIGLNDVSWCVRERTVIAQSIYLEKMKEFSGEKEENMNNIYGDVIMNFLGKMTDSSPSVRITATNELTRWFLHLGKSNNFEKLADQDLFMSFARNIKNDPLCCGSAFIETVFLEGADLSSYLSKCVYGLADFQYHSFVQCLLSPIHGLLTITQAIRGILLESNGVKRKEKVDILSRMFLRIQGMSKDIHHLLCNILIDDNINSRLSQDFPTINLYLQDIKQGFMSTDFLHKELVEELDILIRSLGDVDEDTKRTFIKVFIVFDTLPSIEHLLRTQFAILQSKKLEEYQIVTSLLILGELTKTLSTFKGPTRVLELFDRPLHKISRNLSFILKPSPQEHVSPYTQFIYVRFLYRYALLIILQYKYNYGENQNLDADNILFRNIHLISKSSRDFRSLYQNTLLKLSQMEPNSLDDSSLQLWINFEYFDTTKLLLKIIDFSIRILALLYDILKKYKDEGLHRTYKHIYKWLKNISTDLVKHIPPAQVDDKNNILNLARIITIRNLTTCSSVFSEIKENVLEELPTILNNISLHHQSETLARFMNILRTQKYNKEQEKSRIVKVLRNVSTPSLLFKICTRTLTQYALALVKKYENITLETTESCMIIGDFFSNLMNKLIREHSNILVHITAPANAQKMEPGELINNMDRLMEIGLCELELAYSLTQLLSDPVCERSISINSVATLGKYIISNFGIDIRTVSILYKETNSKIQHSLFSLTKTSHKININKIYISLASEIHKQSISKITYLLSALYRKPYSIDYVSRTRLSCLHRHRGKYVEPVPAPSKYGGFFFLCPTLKNSIVRHHETCLRTFSSSWDTEKRKRIDEPSEFVFSPLYSIYIIILVFTAFSIDKEMNHNPLTTLLANTITIYVNNTIKTQRDFNIVVGAIKRSRGLCTQGLFYVDREDNLEVVNPEEMSRQGDSIIARKAIPYLMVVDTVLQILCGVCLSKFSIKDLKPLNRSIPFPKRFFSKVPLKVRAVRKMMFCGLKPLDVRTVRKFISQDTKRKSTISSTTKQNTDIKELLAGKGLSITPSSSNDTESLSMSSDLLEFPGTTKIVRNININTEIVK